MPSPGRDAVKLAGDIPETAIFVFGGPGGSLVIELYDYSPLAQAFFGNDVATQIHVAAQHKPKLMAQLLDSEQPLAFGGDSQLFALLRDRFRDFYEIQRWLQANGIPLEKHFDDWA